MHCKQNTGKKQLKSALIFNVQINQATIYQESMCSYSMRKDSVCAACATPEKDAGL